MFITHYYIIKFVSLQEQENSFVQVNLIKTKSLFSPWWTIFLPLPFPPQGDGWKWEKVEGWEKYQIDNEDQLTDGESD